MKKLRGHPVSPGIAIGNAFLYLESDLPEIPRRKIRKNQIEKEISRFKTALEEAAGEIRGLYEKAKGDGGKEQEEILFAHLMMIEDVDFQDQVISSLEENLENIEWVLYEASRSLMQKMLSSPDQYFRERATDIKDVSSRIMNRLLPAARVSLAELDKDVIVVAQDLLPSEMLSMNRNHVKGIVMDMGGPTSHTAILARTFNIPAVLGLSFASSEIKAGDTLILDAGTYVRSSGDAPAGDVIINPDKKDLDYWEEIRIRHNKKIEEFSQIRDLPAETKDGHRVLLKANIEIPDESEALLQFGAEGIGLYRSEFFFLNPGESSDEENQFRTYSRVLKAMRNRPVTIRTVDIGGDKILPDLYETSEKNPLLGWRAIRFSLARPDFFKTQLRAILRSSVNGNVRIMFPLISGLEELDDATAMLEEARAECRKKNQPFAENIKVGIMIEVPSAAMIADILAKRTDFFSIGTNDLSQYSMAIDRGNEKVNYLAQPLHPALLRLIKMSIDAAKKQGIPAAMCGEMAGDPNMTALLLGLGLDEFSMAASSIPLVKRIVREVEIPACRKLASILLRGVSSMSNEDVLKSWMAEHIPGE